MEPTSISRNAPRVSPPRGEICPRAEFTGKWIAGLYPFSIIFEDDTLPALHAAADSFIDAKAWVQTINNNIDIQVNSGRDGCMHTETPRDQDTENSDHKDKSPKTDEKERTEGLEPGLPRPKFEKRLLRQRSRQESFIVVVDSGDEDDMMVLQCP